jgi:hypothetical protein
MIPGGLTQTSSSAPQLRSLVYRYFFFGWLFRDVTRGTLLERAAAWRHNRETRRFLPIYLRRWTILFAGGYGLGVVFEHAFDLIYAAACCYSGSCVSASVIFVILLSWFSLRPR